MLDADRATKLWKTANLALVVQSLDSSSLNNCLLVFQTINASVLIPENQLKLEQFMYYLYIPFFLSLKPPQFLKKQKKIKINKALV